MSHWVDFYTPFFPSDDAVRNFVGELEALDRSSPRHQAKILMHQIQRLISIVDDLEKIRPGKQSLQLAFLIICCENVAKLFHNFQADGQSKAYVRRFFNELTTETDRTTLGTAFVKHDMQPLSIQEVADTLYQVRCDVLHEGNYWGFHFHDGNMAILNSEPGVIVSIQFYELRNIVVRGAIEAVNRYAP